MTTPNPSPVAGLIEALDSIVAGKNCHCYHPDDPLEHHAERCVLRRLSAALATFRARPRLRDVPEAYEAVVKPFLMRVAMPLSAADHATRAALDALETALFGDRP